MRIIDPGRRHDYYDGVQAMGQDRSIVYIREQVEIDLTNRYDFFHEGFVHHTIGFCGILHPLLRATFQGGRTKDCVSPWCYSIEDCDRFVEQLDDGAVSRMYYEPVNRRVSRFAKQIDNPTYEWIRREMVVRHFDGPAGKRRERMIGAFVEHGSPVIAWEPRKLIVNPLLQSYEFYRKRDAYSAFQDLQSYIGGVMAAAMKPIPPISDEIMVEIKGFDCKRSFRKEKSG